VKSTTLFAAVTAALVTLPLFATDSPDLFQAVRNNEVAALQAQLKAGADVNAKDKRGATLLMHAAAFGSPAAMQALLDAGADVNAKNEFDATALLWASGDPQKVRMLVEHGANVNAASKQGRTPLIVAAATEGNSAAVRLLLEKGAMVSAADNLGITALATAASAGDMESVRLLLAKGADVNIADKANFTPLLGAAGSGNVELVKLLLAKGAKVNVANTFSGTVKFGPIQLIKLTPLMMATPHGTPELVRALLDAGAEINATDSRGMTALMFAVASETQNPEVVRMLLKAGADVNVKSNVGETALDWALKYNHPAVLAALRGSGAKTSAAVTAPKPDAPPARGDMRASVEKGVAILQRSSTEFFKQSGCVGCHHQNLTAMAVQSARSSGVHVDESANREQHNVTRFGWATFGEGMLQRLDPPGGLEMVGFALFGLAAAGHQPDAVSDAMVFDVASMQRSDGSWSVFGIARAPISDSNINRTAMGLRCLQLFGMPGRKGEFDSRTNRARAWLQEAKPQTNDDYAMRLMGLVWSKADPAAIKSAAQQLAARQRADGGWAQNVNSLSDAYATGQALWALEQAGRLKPGDGATRKAASFLTNSQFADGSWYVRSKAPKFQPYFQSGFPYDHDQWISASATAWATMALSGAVAPQSAAVR
jgi:ankyrin repeat protein